MGRIRKKIHEVNLLDLIPERVIGHDHNETGIVTLHAPRIKNKLLKRWLEPRLKRPFIKVKLDEIGSAVWLLCNGKRNIGEIAGLISDRFGEKIEPCHDRLGVFFQQLDSARFIHYPNYEECLKRLED